MLPTGLPVSVHRQCLNAVRCQCHDTGYPVLEHKSKINLYIVRFDQGKP